MVDVSDQPQAASPAPVAVEPTAPSMNEGGPPDGGAAAAVSPSAGAVVSPSAGAVVSPSAGAVVEPPLAQGDSRVWIALDELIVDGVFCLRSDAALLDVSGLATDIARLGQLFPVDVRPAGDGRYQLVCGFRRVAALKLLQRDRVAARVHVGLADDDAWLLALAAAIHGRPVDRDALVAIRDRLESQGALKPSARDMLEKALATDDALGPEAVEEEVDADELAADVTTRLGDCNQDLALLADVFGELDEERRAELLRQLKYSVELVSFLERQERGA